MVGTKRDYILETNIGDAMMALLMLSKRGYGSLPDLMELDTPEVLDAIEFEQMANAIEAHEYKEAQANG